MGKKPRTNDLLELITREEFERLMDRVTALEMSIRALRFQSEKTLGNFMGVAEDVINLHNTLGQHPVKTREAFARETFEDTFDP